MFDCRVVLLASPEEFPQAQHYAECFSMLFVDMDNRMKYKEYNPSRHDYYKVYIAVKDKAKYEKIIDSHAAEFPCEYTDVLPDYRKKEARKVAGWLVSKSYIDPFDDIKATAIRQNKAEKLDSAIMPKQVDEPKKVPMFKRRRIYE